VQKQKIFLIAGIVLAILAAVMTKFYIDQQVRLKDQVREKEVEERLANQAAVLVAKENIPKGTALNEELLETAIIPNQYVAPQAATSLSRVDGMVAIAPFAKGEQISLSKLAAAREVGTQAGLASATPIGKRAITISVDNIASVAGMIKPGDYVDVVAMVSVPVQTAEGKQAAQEAVVPLFQNVLVLAVGQETGEAVRESGRYQKEERQEASPLITLALSPQEANILAFVQEQGKLRLMLRSPADSKIEEVQPAGWDALFRYIMPRQAAAPEAAQKEEPAPEAGAYVEVYRGLNKEKMHISK
jgi:pilus assembly protein CpaB